MAGGAMAGEGGRAGGMRQPLQAEPTTQLEEVAEGHPAIPSTT